jgi:hypothetical protein
VRSAFFIVLFAAVAGWVPAATVYIAPSSAWQISTWRYLPGRDQPAANWREITFDDAGWNSGKAPFGYGVGGFVRYGTTLAEGPDRHATLYLRKVFHVDDLAQTGALKLSVNFSDGFIAWINGVEVAAYHAPASRTGDAIATAAHPASAEHRYRVFPVSAASIRRGGNVLAVQLLRPAAHAAARHFDASLIDTRNLAFNRPATASSVNRSARFFQPYAGVDGTQLTFWIPDKPAADPVAWLSVDLGARYIIDRARLHWWGGRLPGLGGGARDYELEVSDDARTWTIAATTAGQNGGEQEVHFPPAGARHVRLRTLAPNEPRSYGLLEFEVYAQGVPVDAREFESLALHKPASASSIAWRGAPPAKAVDNNAGSWWESSPAADDPQWLEVDLETPRRITGVRVYFTERYATRFQMQVAGDEQDWHNPDHRLDSEEVTAGDNHRIHRITFASPQEARRVRVLLWDKNPRVDRYAITELMILGAHAHPDRAAQ